MCILRTDNLAYGLSAFRNRAQIRRPPSRWGLKSASRTKTQRQDEGFLLGKGAHPFVHLSTCSFSELSLAESSTTVVGKSNADHPDVITARLPTMNLLVFSFFGPPGLCRSITEGSLCCSPSQTVPAVDLLRVRKHEREPHSLAVPCRCLMSALQEPSGLLVHPNTIYSGRKR